MSKATAKTAPHPNFPMPHPSASIAIPLKAMEDSKNAIATRLGISRRPLYDLLDGKTTIPAPTALRLERVISGSAEFWLSHQTQIASSSVALYCV